MSAPRRALLALSLLAAACDDDGPYALPAARDASVAAPPPDGGELDDPCQTAYRARASTRPAAPVRGGLARDPSLDAVLNAASTMAPYTNTPMSVSAAILADLDGDGRDDILVNDQRDVSGGFGTPPSSVWIALQRSEIGFTTPTRLAGAHSCQLAADLDGDGRLDLVCALDRGGRGVLWGGAEGFSEMRASAVPTPDTSIAIGAWDLDDDGVLDLVLSAFGRRSRVFRATGDRGYEDVTERWGVDVEGLTFQAAFFDLDGDGRHDMYFSDDGEAHENRALRSIRADDAPEPRFERFRPTPERCDREGHFGRSNAAGMGVAIADLNADGRSELMLATGPELPVLARRREAPFHWIDVQAQLELVREATSTGSFLVPWSPVFWDLDHDGAIDLLIATGDDLGFSKQPNRGDSRVLLYRARPDGRFREESTAFGLNLAGQYAHLQLGDLDHDGDLDVVVGRWGNAPIALRNNVIASGRHTLLALRGRVSNPHGLGAEVYVSDEARVHPVGDRWVSWGTAQPTLDLTLPDDPTRDALRVRWPSGCEQRVSGPFGARTTITEPAWLTLSPDGRHLRAGSDDTRVVRVDPAAFGASADAAVEIEALGAAPWRGPTQRGEDGAWSRTLGAPSAPGSIVLRVRVGDRTAPIRPRIWVDPA